MNQPRIRELGKIGDDLKGILGRVKKQVERTGGDERTSKEMDKREVDTIKRTQHRLFRRL